MSWHAICCTQPTAPAAPASALPTVVDMSTDSENEVPQLRGNRFAPLGESQVGRDVGNRRRLVLISQRTDDVRDREWDSDTESVGRASDVEVSEVVEPTVAENPVILEARMAASNFATRVRASVTNNLVWVL